MNYNLVSLHDLLEDYDEESVTVQLSAFKCSKDKELEDFLCRNSIIYEKRDMARTYLAVSLEMEIVGYFSLGIRCGSIPDDLTVSKSLYKKLNVNRDTGVAQMFLIAQLGRSDDSPKGLGRSLMEDAFYMLLEANRIVGCRVIRIDCKPAQSLVDYYSQYGFVPIRQNLDIELTMMVCILQDWQRRIGLITGMITEVDLIA